MNHKDVATLSQALPPRASAEVESALVGSMILDPSCIDEIHAILPDKDMIWNPKLKEIFGHITDMHRDGHTIEMPLVKQRLEQHGVIEEKESVKFLIGLVEGVPSSVSAPHYARMIRDAAIRRKLIDKMAHIVWGAYDHDKTTHELLESAQETSFSLSQELENDVCREARAIGEITKSLYESLATKTLTKPMPTGFQGLDQLINGGLCAGQNITIAARPGVGKSSLAGSMALNIATGMEFPCVIYSLEMSSDDVALRILCGKTGIGISRAVQNGMDLEDFSKMAIAAGSLNKVPLYISDRTHLTVSQLRSGIRRMVSKHAVKVVFIDYLQLASSGNTRNESRQVDVADISRAMKSMALECQVAIVCLSQLNRMVEAREDKRPRLSDLRDSGAIEQDADVVILLYNPNHHDRQDHDYVPGINDSIEDVELIVAKQRNGPTGTVRLRFDKTRCLFSNPGIWRV